MSSDKRKVFVVGLDAANLAHLHRLPRAADCTFHAALEIGDIRGVDHYDLPALIDTAAQRMQANGPPSAVIAYFDFPASTLVPILAARFGLPGPSLRSVLECEHKYWSRRQQQTIIPEHIPRFRAFDPCSATGGSGLPMPPPFWVKPIKSYRSYMGFLVNDEPEFLACTAQLCAHAGYIVEPFRALLRAYHMPADIADMPETCLAESLIGGAQCTAEGYVWDGEPAIYGVVDSIRERDRSSFARYQYPCSLPTAVQQRMADIACRAVRRSGLDNACFNAELFWDQSIDHVWLLEINPRLSQAHTEIFELVHGVSHHKHALDIALGYHPSPLPSTGSYPMAANCHVRVFHDGRVKRVPSADECRRVADEIPGTSVRVRVRRGQRLCELTNEDSYSYEVANVFVGGADELELLEKYHRALDILTFEIERTD
ncbi:ATP-grasp domain-containing protein [Arhodomonas sp. AD133]|uniref:ATP-grasp domain-containing protein n=1 Tax=Arhodomonas sp. AD133 TaxID=3415009 RepID=UPI003EBDCE83